MNKRIYSILLFLFVLVLHASAQQWERLPIHGGALYQLEQSIFDPNIIVGYLENGGVYRSTDFGVSWEVLYEGSTFLWDLVRDVEVLADGTVLALTSTGLWGWAEEGRSWNIVHEGLRRKIFFGSYLSTDKDKNLLVCVHVDTPPYALVLYRDPWQTWDTLSTEPVFFDPFIDGSFFQLFCLVDYSNVMFSTTGGASWETHHLPNRPSTAIAASFEGETLVWCMFMEDRDTPTGDYHYYESRDTGRSWVQLSSVIDFGVHKAFCESDKNNRIVRYDSSRIVANVCSSFLVSEDGGRSWSMSEMQMSDLVACGDTLVASVFPEGILLSPDRGRTWKPQCHAPVWYGYPFAEIVHARGDTLFALLSEPGTSLVRYSELRQSTDRGNSWKFLFRRKGLHHLETDAGLPSRYYLAATPEGGARAILTGVVDQTFPDTLSTSVSWAVLGASKAFPGHLYRNTYFNSIRYLGYSSDGGRNWLETGFSSMISSIRIFPSMIDPERIVVAAEPRDILFDDMAGLYYTSDGGLTWQFINDDADPYAYVKYAVAHNDTYILNPTLEMSTDYGRTWVVNRLGVDSAAGGLDLFNPHGRVIGTDRRVLYEFEQDRWHVLFAADGDTLRSTGWETSMALDREFVYITAPGRGIYRAELGIPSLVETVHVPKFEAIRALYPSPATSTLTVLLNVPDYQSTRLQILDLLGRVLYNGTLDSGTNTWEWDLRGNAGRRVGPCVYLLRVLRRDGLSTKQFVIQ